MLLNFIGEIATLTNGIDILKEELNFETSKSGLRVYIEKHDKDILYVSKNSDGAFIKYKDNIHFFRALGLLIENLAHKSKFEICEKIQFSMNGAMFDVSQSNAAMNLETIKYFLRKMSLMGLNTLMIYTEDSYEINNWEYFGYMRSRYTHQDFREIDAYAISLGIELIPCIQTLAHLSDALKWDCFNGMRDDEDTLLVGSSKVYKFIEDMIASIAESFNSKRIHLGMDEAWKLGQGEYLKKNGYKSKFEIMLEHLNKVLEITDKYKLKPMIWSDMFFRAGSPSGDYYDIKGTIPKKVISSYPQNVQLVYWDYYHDNEDFYIDFIKRHKNFGTNPIFAGGIWTWTSFAANFGKTFSTTNAAMSACKKENIKEVFTTIWGDDNTECNIYTNLLGLQLFAEHGYSNELDMKKLDKRFKFTTGMDMDKFIQIKYLDEIPSTPKDNIYNFNASKCLMWQDILGGLFDKEIQGLNLNIHYKNLAEKFNKYKRDGQLASEIFGFYEKVASVLSIKSEIGIHISTAYKKNDKTKLEKISKEILPELLIKVEDLRKFHRDLWMKTNKAFGWEVFDLRYGCLINRIDTAIYRISNYLSGEIETILELEEKRLSFTSKPYLTECNLYARICFSSKSSMVTIPLYCM